MKLLLEMMALNDVHRSSMTAMSSDLLLLGSLLAATNERNHAVSPPNHKKLRPHFIIKSVLESNVWHYYVHMNLWNCNCDDEFIYENVYVKEVVLIMCMCSSVRAGGWAAWPGTNHQPIWAVDGSWAASPAPWCCPNTSSSRLGWTGPGNQTRSGPVLTCF